MKILFLLLIYSIIDSQDSFYFPAPYNATLVSNNFQHILRWSPGRDTPPQMTYSVKRWKNGREKWIAKGFRPRNHAIDVSRYMNDIYEFYNFQLWALLGNRSSVVNVTPSDFCPYEMTTIGPPAVEALGCGDCLNITILLPKGQGIKPNDSDIYYNQIRFNLHWKKAQDEKDVSMVLWDLSRPNQNATHAEFVYVLENLQPQQEYCVKVQPEMTVNPCTSSSSWICASTSTAQTSGDLTPLIGWCTVSVLMGLFFLVITVSLAYTGVLCRLKETLPKALTGLALGYYASLEEVCFSVAEYDCDARINKSKYLLQPVEGGHTQANEEKGSSQDEEEEDEDSKMENHFCYMERGADLRDSWNINNVQSSANTTIFPSEPATHSGGCNFEGVTAQAEAIMHQPQVHALKDDKQMSFPYSEEQDKQMSFPNSEGQDKQMSFPYSEEQDKQMSFPYSEGQDKQMSLPNSEGQDEQMSFPNSEGQDKQMSFPYSEGQDKQMSLPNSEGQDKQMSFPYSEGQDKQMSFPYSEEQDKQMSFPYSEGQDKQMSLPNSEGQDKQMSFPNSEGQDKQMSFPYSEGQDKQMSLPNLEGQDKQMSFPYSEGQDKQMYFPNSEGQEPKPPKVKELEKERRKIKEETQQHGLRNINLLSVTLTSMQVEDEVNEDTEICEPLLPVVLRDPQGHALSLSNPQSGKPQLSALQAAGEVDTLTGQQELMVYSEVKLNCSDQAENERCLQESCSSEEDEDFSGYMRR